MSVTCGCGCGAPLMPTRRPYPERRFLPGHNGFRNERTCRRCNLLLPRSSFDQVATSTRSLKTVCRECVVANRPKPTPAPVRFWAKVNKDGPVQAHMDSPCWVWTGAKSGGYGLFKVDGDTTMNAHRYSWLSHHGSLPNARLLRHVCDVPLCVRVDHLLPGDDAMNARDKVERGRMGRAAKLTASDVREIRESDMSTAGLADRYGVSAASISGVLARRSWTHI